MVVGPGRHSTVGNSRGYPDGGKYVGPKAWDNSYARLVWQMPEGGPEVTYEWAETAKNEMVGPLTHSQPAPARLQGYVPWDSAPPQFSVLYSEGAGTALPHCRLWVPAGA